MARAKPSCAAIASRLARGLGQHRVGGDDGDGGVAAGCRLSRNFSRILLASAGIGDGIAEPAELVADLEGRRPEMPAVGRP